ncbi:uncharacterized protein LOC131843490 [Achroia grisella]|uniref:uncharacterized protein LOC131843490 n=1 Tax=Achroia grisella TaxID=688607 RepID=UPI0027D21A10|nr:uncharacterized protein LOC131843490 [Achroia grisella]
MKILCSLVLFTVVIRNVLPAPAAGFVFPDDTRRQKKLEPITPPVLPILEHLERDPSTLLPNERTRSASSGVQPKFGFGGGFNVGPSQNGGLSASISSSAGGPIASHSASHSFSFGFNEGFGASQSASQSSSFGFGSFSGSQASSQAASFQGPGGSVSGAASSASSVAGGFNSGSGSQSASSAFGFNSLGGFGQPDDTNFNDAVLDIRHRGVPNFPIPEIFRKAGGVGAASFRKVGPTTRNGNDFISVFVAN